MDVPKTVTVRMGQFLCKRKIYLLILCVSCTAFIVYSSETGDSFFGQNQNACDGENCDGTASKTKSESGLDLEHQETETNQNEQDSVDESTKNPEEINIIITFTNAVHNINLQKQFTQTVSSLLHHSSIALAIHIIGEKDSQRLAAEIIKNNAGEARYRMINLDVDKLAKDLESVVTPMQQHFSSKPGSYYHHALFFLSIAIHRIMSPSLHKVIMMDADLKFTDDIKKLYDRFDQFTDENIIGIGHELQPVYRHTFWEYRQKNPGTRVGEPPPNGLTGFNSGVLLLHLDNMRKSKLYNSILNSDSIKKLTEEFFFKGHLGDQDFFTLLSMKYENLFHVLPCSWNRQLCTWWKEHGYKDVFDSYYNCPEDIKIWHGNCNTPIP